MRSIPPAFTDLTFPNLLGWGPDLSSHLPERTVPARVVAVHRGAADLWLTVPGPPPHRPGPGHGTAAASPDPPTCRISLASQLPGGPVTVGDWLAVRPSTGDGWVADSLLPRRTAVTRAEVSGSSVSQVLAANVDVVMCVAALSDMPNRRRLDRLLAVAWGSGATAAVVLTKADLAADADVLVDEVGTWAPGCDVLAVSTVTGTGLHAVRSLLGPGRTGVLLGPSGAGKSSLVNSLLGHDTLAVEPTRRDGKGRHTTVTRSLVVLPGGGMVIDTPGLRGIGLVGDDEAVDGAFDDVVRLAAECRFRDCRHAGEPGCAVQAAVEAGTLAAARFDSWLALRREAAWMARRADVRLAAEERRKWKQITKANRSRTWRP